MLQGITETGSIAYFLESVMTVMLTIWTDVS